MKTTSTTPPSMWARLLLSVLVLSVFASPVGAKTVVPESPEETAAVQKSYDFVSEGEKLLASGNYSAAEQDFRAALAIKDWNVTADPGLAEALASQGRTQEALQVYRSLVYQYPANLSSDAQSARTLMRFASLLSQTGQWSEAVPLYNYALARADFGDAPKLDAHFDPQTPMPLELQALSHIAVGMEYGGHADNKKSFAEFTQALQLAPDMGLTNYYYGVGWQKLSPTERVKFGTAQQAKAALQKAVKIGNAEVKAAAAKALKNAG